MARVHPILKFKFWQSQKAAQKKTQSQMTTPDHVLCNVAGS